ncbi:hypothetical protein K3169_00710 [Pseudomonas phytophila]|uniref:Uncharacterized protein n=1 Tax=Pseudomonas phytophila TaxID=2867264 RepID=A0ABY6FN37_9PSED|nr:hypothetical protein K3169_00710 [Pseudomonas phytophila]
MRKIEIATQAIADEIIRNKNNALLFTTNEQLEQFKAVLDVTLIKIIFGSVPEKSDRNLGLAKIIVDKWPYEFSLGIKIVEAEQAYKDL